MQAMSCQATPLASHLPPRRGTVRRVGLALGGAGLALLLAGCGALEPTPAAAEARSGFARAMGQWVAADGPAALATLAALAPEDLDAPRRATRACILARFAPGAARADTVEPGLPAELAAVLRAYKAYWTASLMHRSDAAQAEEALRRELAAAGEGAAPEPTLPAQADAARALAGRLGWHALGGVTPPLQEFMLWRQQTSGVQTVALPEGPVDVAVTRLDGFASLGWLAYATCDRHHTGGWATREGLMVVAPAWDMASEAYRVSLLAHEAQHFADYRRFPQLAATDLEFRAKLVELMLARDTHRDLVEAFAAQASPQRTSAHAFASHQLVTRLRARLGGAALSTADSTQLREAAAAELRAHTQALQARGPALVQSVLPD